MNCLHPSCHLLSPSKWWPCLVWCLHWPHQVMVHDGQHLQHFQETQEGTFYFVNTYLFSPARRLSSESEYYNVSFRTPSPPVCRSCWTPRWSVRATPWRRSPGSPPGCRVSCSTRDWRTRTGGRCFTSVSTLRYWGTRTPRTNWRPPRLSCWRWEDDTSLIGSIKNPAYTSQTFTTSCPRYSGLLVIKSKTLGPTINLPWSAGCSTLVWGKRRTWSPCEPSCWSCLRTRVSGTHWSPHSRSSSRNPPTIPWVSSRPVFCPCSEHWSEN